jgi:tryptophan-rich sensory protein
LRWPDIRGLIGFGLATAAVAWLGSLATSSSVDSQWFESLQKPVFYPPSQTFGIVWTILYVMIAIAGWLAWRDGGGTRTLRPWILQIVLNLAWSVVFFGLRSPGWALPVIAGLLAAAIWSAVEMKRLNGWAAALFIPYILWIGFASILNGAIVALN